MNIFDENLFVINESYFRKSKNMLKAEEAVRKLKEEIMAAPNKNPNNSKNLKDLGNAFAEEFGFEEVILTVYADKVMPNGFTFKFMQNAKVGSSVAEMALQTTKNGIRYKVSKNKKVAIFLATQIFLDGNVDEIMGVYMHEIGHNFYISDYCYKFAKVSELIEVYTKFIESFRKAVVTNSLSISKIMKEIQMISKFNKDMRNLKKEIILSDGTYLPDPRNFEELINYYRTYYVTEYEKMIKESNKQQKNFDDYKEKLKNPSLLRRFATVFFTIIFSPFSLLEWLLSPLEYLTAIGSNEFLDSRLDEKFADNFACSYGYGAGLVIFFKKFEELRNDLSGLPSEEMRKKTPLYTAIKKMQLYRDIKSSLVNDVHPSDRSRMNFVKSKIEYELNNCRDLTKEERKDLENQLLKVMECLNNKNEVVEMYEKIEGKFKYEEKLDKKMDYSDKDIFDFDKTMQQEYIDAKREDAEIVFAIEEDQKYPLITKEDVINTIDIFNTIDSEHVEEVAGKLLEAINKLDMDIDVEEDNAFYVYYQSVLEEDTEIDKLLDNLF